MTDHDTIYAAAIVICATMMLLTFVVSAATVAIVARSMLVDSRPVKESET